MKEDAPQLAPQPTKGERTRLHILERSITCFVRNGFDGASFTELTELCDVNRGLFFHYFRSKQKLIEESLAHVGGNLRGYTDEFMVQRDDIADPIERYVDATFEWSKLYPDHASYLVYCIQRAVYDPAVGKVVRLTFHKAWERLQGLIEGRYNVRVPLETGQQIHSAVVGTVLLSITMGKPTVEMYRSHCKAMARALVGTARAPSRKGTPKRARITAR